MASKKDMGVTMNPREREKIEEIGERTYRIRKMPVWDSSFLLKFVAEKCLPVLQTLMGIGENEEEDKEKTIDFIQTVPALLAAITQEDLKQIIMMCLRFVDVSLQAGWQPVMIGENWGIEDIEYETDTCLILCFKVIVFNCGSFFAGSVFNLGALTNAIGRQRTR